MNKFRIYIFIFLIVNSYFTIAQKYTISGYVKNENNGEDIIGATIFEKSTKQGTATNSYGFYSLSLPKGEYEVSFRSLGFENQSEKVNLNKDINLNISLKPADNEIEEVVVTGESSDKNIKDTETGVISVNPQKIKAVPIIFGEQDLLKTIQLLPGVMSAGEGSSGFYVRGGGADQNLILLDEAPVYNASHLMGFFSVFNSDAVKNVKLYKGTAPADFGGRLSSVLDIKMKEGNSKKITASGGLGLISSRLMLESPIVNDKASIMVSGRRSYADLFLVFAPREEQRNSTLYFYDLNAKINYTVNKKNRLFLSGYYGRDVFSFNDMMGMDWGNTTGTLRWNHIFGSKLFLNSSFIFSNYNYLIGFGFEDASAEITSAIQDYNLKEDFHYYYNANSTFNFGINLIHHTFLPGEIKMEGFQGFNGIKVSEKFALESAAYLSHEYKFNDNLSVVYGLRYSLFNNIGPGVYYSFDEYQNVRDSIVFDDFKIMNTHGGFEPRLSVNYVINQSNSIKASLTRNIQYIHMLSNSTSSSPTDIWYPVTKIVQPGVADLVSLGYYKNFKENMFESSVEIYYKKMDKIIDYRNGANILLNKYLEAELVFGQGYSYGLEFYFNKAIGDLTGWISYTWSVTERQFDEINNGLTFPAKHDRRHDLSITLIYTLANKWNFSLSWVYYTGDAVTFPSGRYMVEGYPVSLYTERNGYRMPDYHRLDAGITYKSYTKKKRESSWNLSVYNAYARKNAYSISFRPKEDNPAEFEAVRLALFSIIPSLTYNFKF